MPRPNINNFPCGFMFDIERYLLCFRKILLIQLVRRGKAAKVGAEGANCPRASRSRVLITPNASRS